MSTLLRIDEETLPRVLVLDPPMSDAEFETLCRENNNVQFERIKEGAIRMHICLLDSLPTHAPLSDKARIHAAGPD